jgi:hypothetical protein
VYPDLDGVCKAQDSQMEALLGNHNHKAYADSVREGTLRQGSRRRTRVVLQPAAGSALPSNANSSVSSPPVASTRSEAPGRGTSYAPQTPSDSSKVQFTLVPIPPEKKTKGKKGVSSLPALPKRYLRTDGSALVASLCSFLRVKLQLEGPFSVCVRLTDGSYENVSHSISLAELNKQHTTKTANTSTQASEARPQPKEPLSLFYKLKQTA